MRVVTASRYNILIPLKGGGCLGYNSLRGGLAKWEPHETEAYEQLCAGAPADSVDPEVLKQLEHGGFVVDPDVDERSIVRDMYERRRFSPATMTLTIAPTMACNFGCDYCFQGQDKPSQHMNDDVQDAIVALVERIDDRVTRKLVVAWYGGEPLLRLPIIEALSDRIIAICRRKQIHYSAMIVTNGYKLDVDAARSLASRGVASAQITLDGTPEYHDARRYLLGGQGSFERIVDNLRSVADANVPLHLSIRVNIDERNHEDIRSLIDFMSERGLGHRKNLRMYFAPVEAITEGCHVVQDVTLTKGAYSELETELYRYAYAAGLSNLPYPPRFQGMCAAIKPASMVILPSGDVHKCWDTVSWPYRKVGTIFEPGQIAAHPQYAKWLAWTPFDNQTCRNCKLLPNCAGACAYKFVHADSTRGEAATLPCPSWKYNIKERLLWRAVAMGKVRDDEYDPSAVRTVPSELCADEFANEFSDEIADGFADEFSDEFSDEFADECADECADGIATGEPRARDEMRAHGERKKHHLPVVA